MPRLPGAEAALECGADAGAPDGQAKRTAAPHFLDFETRRLLKLVISNRQRGQIATVSTEAPGTAEDDAERERWLAGTRPALKRRRRKTPELTSSLECRT